MNKAIFLADYLNSAANKDLPYKGIISVKWDGIDGTEVHVTESYFDEHMEGMQATATPLGKDGIAQVTVKTESGASVFCLKYNFYKVTMVEKDNG